ncbi:hypothetical protein AAVH_09256 [Aphelenchoides avenae]|nr:hypothetical protein AAVH_09256 [Aphelenchus avenae]
MQSSVVYTLTVLIFMCVIASSFAETSAHVQQKTSMSGSPGNTVVTPSNSTVAASASERPEGAQPIVKEAIAEARIDAVGEKVPHDAKPPGVPKRPRDHAGGNYTTESREQGLWQLIYATLAASDPARLLQAFLILFITALLYTYRDGDVESFWDFFRPPEIVVEEMISCQ